MIKKIFTYYKLPLLISIAMILTLLGLGVVRKPIGIAEIVIGCLLGTFILDLEYILSSYLLEPESEFSKSVQGFIKYRDFGSLIEYIQTHKGELKEKALNSALFQAILAPIAIFVVYAKASLVIQALVLSVLANSIYKLLESYFDGSYKDWFWALKAKPKKEGVVGFILLLLFVLLFCLYIY